MGWRFNRRIRIFKGVYLNVSKSGTSLTARAKGFSVTTGKNHARMTIGIPGTGLSYSKVATNRTGQRGAINPPAQKAGCFQTFLMILGASVWIIALSLIAWSFIKAHL